MGGSNPVVLVGLLTAVSLVITIFKWHDAPQKIPIWWDLHAHPWLWVPRWFGMFFLPVLTFLVPYALYMSVVNNIESHGHESKHSIFHLVTLPAIFLFITQTFVMLPAAVNDLHTFPARTFVANIALWLLIWFGHNIKHVEPNMVVGIINPWTTNSSWDNLHSQAGTVFEVCGVILFILAFFLPVGWPLTLGLIFLWLGPWLVSYGLAYTSAEATENADRSPLITA
jgi:uncharacterized membrane protein